MRSRLAVILSFVVFFVVWATCSTKGTVIAKQPDGVTPTKVRYLSNLLNPDKYLDLGDGLAAYYSFDDGSASDISGNNNHGTVVGAFPVPGIIGGAIEFDGLNDYIEVPHSPSLNLYNEFTISGWINNVTPYTTNFDWVTILSKGNTSSLETPYTVYYYVINDEILPSVRLTDQDFNLILDTQNDITSGNSLYLDQWTFFTWRLSGGKLAIFMNGILLGEKDYGFSSLGNNSLPLDIGRDVPGVTEYFDGQIDELRIYNRALSIDEIETLYEQGGFIISKLRLPIIISE